MGNTMGAWEAHIAIKQGDIPLLTEQLNLGKLNTNVRFRGETLLCTSIKQNQLIITQLLLNHGANPNLKSEESGRYEPPLITATRLKNYKIVQILLENGADIHSSNFYGNDVIFQAVIENAFGILEYLLNHLTHGSSKHTERNTCPLILSIKNTRSYPLKKKCLFLLLKYNYLCKCILHCFNSTEDGGFNNTLNEIFPKEFNINEIFSEPDPDVLRWIYISKGIKIIYIEKLYNIKSTSILLPLKLKLMNLVRIQIRQYISIYSYKTHTNFVSLVLKLPIPSTLINFLLMKDVV